MPPASCRPPTPARPQGRERNVVVTMWDWADPKVYLHDEIATDKRNPTVNANGPIYGALEESGDYLPVVDPTRNADQPGEADGSRSEDAERRRTRRPPQPSPYWGDEAIWNSQTSDAQLRDGQAGPRVGRVAHPPDRRRRPWCQAGSDHPSAKLFPITQSERGSSSSTIRRPSRPRPIDTCFTLGPRELRRQRRAVVVVRSRRRRGLVRHQDLGQDARREEGAGLDARSSSTTNGNGKRDAYTEPNQPVDPTKDQRINVSFYGVSPAPDGSVWGTVQGMPGGAGALRSRIASARDGAVRVLRSAVEQSEGVRLRALRRAAWTSTARASSGRCCRADSWRASTAASARAR